MGKTNNNYDVILIGAGPAGLAVASELSQHLKVLLIDSKTEVQHTDKSWFVPVAAIEDGNAEDTKAFMYGGVKRFTTNTYAGVVETWDAILEYLYVKEKEILQYWADIITKNGSDILLECYYDDSAVRNDGVTVLTSKGEFNAKMMIDASGAHSPIRKNYPIPDHYYWWSVSGAIVELPDGLHDMKVGDYLLWGTFKDTNVDLDASLQEGRPVLEYEILDEKTCFIFILYLRQSQIDADRMKQEFIRIMREEPATADFYNAKILEWKHGWYPSGGPSSQRIAADRVAFIGSAGCWTTPCGWGMTFILANYKHYAKRLTAAIQQDTLSKDDLKDLIHLDSRTKYQVLLDELTTHFLSFASSKLLDDFIRMFHRGGPLGDQGPLLCEKLFTLSITDAEAEFMLKAVVKHFDLVELMKAVPHEDYLLLLKLGESFIEEAVLSEVHSLLDKIKGGHEPSPFKAYLSFE